MRDLILTDCQLNTNATLNLLVRTHFIHPLVTLSTLGALSKLRLSFVPHGNWVMYHQAFQIMCTDYDLCVLESTVHENKKF